MSGTRLNSGQRAGLMRMVGPRFPMTRRASQPTPSSGSQRLANAQPQRLGAWSCDAQNDVPEKYRLEVK